MTTGAPNTRRPVRIPVANKGNTQTMYQQQVKSGILSSKLPSPEMPDAGVVRAPRGSNPVNADNKGATQRIMMPLAPVANPRIMNPTLNTSPWSTSYAQARSQSKTQTAKSSYRGKKRAAAKKQSMRQRRTGGGA